MRRVWLVLMAAVPLVFMVATWPSWVAVLWAVVWLVALFMAAMLWEEL